MDKDLYEAAKRGDVKFFIERYEAGNYFFPENIQSNDGRNLLHVASSNGHLEFIAEVLKRLPIQLVCQTDKQAENPLHCAARGGHLDIVKLLVDAYRRSSTGEQISDDSHWITRAIESEVGVLSCPPWRAINHLDLTPVHVAALSAHGQVVEFLLLQEPDFLSSVDANNSRSLLRDAVTGRSKSITSRILTSDVAYSTAKFDLHDIMRLATECSENDAVLLLEKHPELVKCCYPGDSGPKRKTILHGAAGRKLVRVIGTVLDIDKSIANIVDKEDQNPLHIAVECGHYKIAKLLINAFNKSSDNTRQQQGEIEEAVAESSNRRARITGKQHAASADLILPPWRVVDKNGYTPLHLAVKLRHQKVARLIRLILWSDLAFLCEMANGYNQYEPGLLVMDVAESVVPDDQHGFMGIYLVTFRQFLQEKLENGTDEVAARKLIQKYGELIRYKDVKGRTILQYLLDENDLKTMSFILGIDRSAIDIQKDQENVEHLLFRACHKFNLHAIQTICQICPQAAQHRGREDKATALHHVGKASVEEYKILLQIPQIEVMKNATDKHGTSPLMKAIQDNELALAKALLTVKGIDTLNVRNKEGNTAADMLKNQANQSPEWKQLYEETSANANSYVPLGTDLKEMRSTLSIVAALLATITFAAAFTVPGGFDQNNGYVIFGQKASFIAFLLSDTYAMCCSMIVLYSLIYATHQEQDKALKTVNLSIKVLHQSLYGTMGAFMAGVYTMISSKSIWVAFVVLFMCSSVVIFSCILISFKFVRKHFRKLNTSSKKDEERDIESGETVSKNTSTKCCGCVQTLKEGNSNRRSSVSSKLSGLERGDSFSL